MEPIPTEVKASGLNYQTVKEAPQWFEFWILSQVCLPGVSLGCSTDKLFIYVFDLLFFFFKGVCVCVCVCVRACVCTCVFVDSWRILMWYFLFVLVMFWSGLFCPHKMSSECSLFSIFCKNLYKIGVISFLKCLIEVTKDAIFHCSVLFGKFFSLITTLI